MEGIQAIRGVFQKEILVVSPDGFSAIWPSARDDWPNETTECIEKGNLDILRKLVRAANSVRISYADGVSAGIKFEIPGFSDHAAIFAPMKRELTLDELQEMITEAGKLDDCPEFIEVFSDADDGVEGYLDFWKRINAQEVFDLRAVTNWRGFLECARKLASVLRDFDFEEQSPNDMGLCYVTFSGPMYDEASEFSITFRDKGKESLSDLLERSSECDMVFCCCEDYSSVDLTFFA